MPNEVPSIALVPQFYSYDYAELGNLSLTCIGEIYTHLGKATVSHAGYEPFFFRINATIPTSDTKSNSYWAQSFGEAYDWQVYRVETASGAIRTVVKGWLSISRWDVVKG